MRRFGAASALLALLGSADATAQECRSFDAGTEIATLSDTRIDEASGLAAGWVNPDLLWTHNDSGDSARVFAIDHEGQTRVVVDLEGATAVDIEDIAIGPCGPADETPCVWVGDIGDNDEVRPSIALYRFPEPTVAAGTTTLSIAPQTIVVTYDGGPRNAETLMVHPTDGRVFIVDKTVGDPSNLWTVPVDGTTPATLVASATLGEVGIVSGRVTGGDFSPRGDEFSIRTYTHIYTYCGDDPATAFARPPSSVIGTHLFQSEALTYARDGQSIFITTEVQSSEQPPLLQMQLVPAAMEPGDDVRPPDMAVTAPDSGPAAESDLSIRIVEKEASRGCSCGVLNRKAEPLSGLGLLFGVAFALSLRRRLRRS